MLPTSRSFQRSVIPLILLASSWSPQARADDATEASTTVVYNHVIGDTDATLEPKGGFSAIVRFADRTILFDTGGERSALVSNMRELGFDPFGLDAVVISHNHWDHVYGLPGLSSMSGENPPVYVPPSAREGIRQQNPRANIVAVDKPVEISPGVWVMGPMDTELMGVSFAEQALVLVREDELVVLVGCSHPGIVEMVEAAKGHFGNKKIALVAGGYHLSPAAEPAIQGIAAALQKLGVERLAPTHCTGDEATEIFRQRWGERLLAFNLGDTIRF